MMRKEMIRRGLHGIPQGIAIGYVISIISALIFGEGTFSAVIPELVEQFNSEMSAVVVQTILSAVLGSTFASMSVVWQIEEWSILKQTSIYFVVTAAVMLPIAYLLHWMERGVVGFISYFGVFVAIFIVIWVIQYLFWKSRINKINEKL